ncbi:MAG: TonB-dependent receptor [Acidobacteria bacterium]|nr:TonB-dependent receptor [Acidobacteriota bacterium]
MGETRDTVDLEFQHDFLLGTRQEMIWGAGYRFTTDNEIGLRTRLSPRASLSISTFYHRYDHLRTVEPGRPFLAATPPPPHLVLPLRFANKSQGSTQGVEASGNWTVLDRWKIGAGYAYLVMHLRPSNEPTWLRSLARRTR